MVQYKQRCKTCADHGCRYCVTGFVVGNGEAGMLRGQLHDVQGLTGRATIVPEEIFKFVTKPKGPNRKRRGQITIPPEAA